MSAAMSTFLANAILDVVLNGAAYPGGSNIYVALYTTPTDDGSGGVEVNGTGYTRVLVSGFEAPASKNTTNSSSVVFPTAGDNWGTITHMALVDASSGGNRLFHGPLVVPKVVNAGDQYTLPIGNISVSTA